MILANFSDPADQNVSRQRSCQASIIAISEKVHNHEVIAFPMRFKKNVSFPFIDACLDGGFLKLCIPTSC